MVKNYDFKKVAVIFGGQLITGFAEGDDAVQVETAENDWELEVGADGEATRSRSNNLAAGITLRLQKGSLSNDILNGFLQADRQSGVGTQPLLIKDNLGRELHGAETAWIEKAPDAAFGVTAGDREWVLRTDKLVSTYGGN